MGQEVEERRQRLGRGLLGAHREAVELQEERCRQ